MVRFIFAGATIFFILILCYEKSLVQFRISRLKNKIRNNPLLGKKESDNSYAYTEEGYTINYTIEESFAGIKEINWLSLKRCLTSLEKRILDIKKGMVNFFIYQKWVSIFRPSVVIILIISLAAFYLGIIGHSHKRIGYFKWVVAKMTGISPEAIVYAGEGRFKITGQRWSLDKKVEPVIISFNPLRWFFASDTANVSIWSNEFKKYVSYPLAINDRGDVWLGRGTAQVHGKVLDDKIIWDETQRVGIRHEASGHRITIEDGQLKIIDKAGKE